MKQRRRRWWTTSISVIAGLLVLTAVVSGLFQLAVLMVPAYRVQLATWVGEVAGQPVDIGGIALRWRGLSPQVELSSILLEGDPGTEFRVEQLRLGFSPWQLLQGDWLPRRILLSGLQLTVDIDTEGRVRVAGLGRGEPGRVSRWREALSRFPTCVLEDATIRVRWAGWPGRPVQLAVDDAQVLETDTGFELALDGRLPEGWGGRIQGSARVTGQAEDLDGWSGDWFLLLAELSPQDIWPDLWRPGARFQPEALVVNASGRFKEGTLSEAYLSAAAQRLQGDVLGEALPPLESPQLALRWTRATEAASADWTAEVEEASVDGQRYGPLTLTRSGEVRRLSLSDWSFEPWAAWFALAEGDWARSAASLRGQIDQLELQQDSRREGLFGEVALRGFGGTFDGSQVAGLDARVVFDGESGTVSPTGGPWTLARPALFERPLFWERFEGDWSWAPLDAGGWRLTAPALRLALEGATAEGALALDLPAATEGERQSPRLNLDLRLEVEDLVALKPYRPQHWDEPLRRWVDRALQAGRVEGGRLQIDGPLADFPFGARPSGEWQLDLPLRDVDLAYGPDWPALTDANIDLRFRGAGLQALGRSARSRGLRLRDIEASIPALQDAEMALTARVDGDLADYYRFLRDSPLRRNLAGLLDRSEAAGPATLDLRLRLPLRAVREAQAEGVLRLREGTLELAGLDGPVEALQGELRFDNRSVSAEGLSARWQDLALDAAILPAEGQPGRLMVGGRLSPTQDRAVAFLPGWLRERLPGRSDWQLELGLGPGERAQLTSDLVGLAIDLPTPLGKTAGEPAAFRLQLPGAGAAELDFGFDDQRLSGRLYRDEDGAPKGLDLHLGGERPAPRARGEGLAISGRLPQAELGDWLALRPASGDGGGWPLRKLDLHIDRLHSGGFSLRDQRVQAERVAEGWLLNLSGAASGQLRWAADGQLLSGALDSVALAYQGLESAPLRAAPRDVEWDPRTWPAVRLDLAALSLNGYPLGRGRLRSTPEADGYRLEELQIGEESLEIAMQGRWWLNQGERRATLGFRLSSTDAESTLAAFGYVPNIQAERAELSGDLAWPADAMLHWTQAEGRLDLLAEQGTLRAVNPGAGRVLGLVNFYTLPRRLALDFRDLTDAGMRFDRIAGRFDLLEGTARTEDLALSGPSLRLQIRGDVDLAHRTLDQRVTVLPGMSGGITLGATLLGGPAAGVIMLIAQELLEKPLDQITQFGYRVRGPWEQPEVTPLDSQDLLAPPEAAAPLPITTPIPGSTPTPAVEAAPPP